MSNLTRIELLLAGLLLAVVAGIAVVASVLQPRPVPVVAEVQPLGTPTSSTTGPTVAPTIAKAITPTVEPTSVPTGEPTTAPTVPPTTTATPVPTSVPTIGVSTPLPSSAATPLPTARPDQTGRWVWWLGGGTVLLLGLALVVVLVRRRRARQRPIPALAILSSSASPASVVGRSLTPSSLEPLTARPTVAAVTLPPLVDERPVLPTLELGTSVDLAAGRRLLSQRLLRGAPDELVEPDTTEADVSVDLAEHREDLIPLPVALAGIIRDALVATGTRSLWLGLQWRGRRATALFRFADDPDATLIALAERITAATGARCRWTAHGLQLSLPQELDPPSRPWPLLLPVLTVERGATWALLLDRWRHLALYGAQAVGVTHQILTRLVTEHAPDELAVALIDPQGLLGTLYGAAPHRLAIDQPPALLLGQCLHALRQGHGATERPLVLVVVEPDDATIAALLLLVRWLQPAPQAPLHLVVVAGGVRPAGRDLYALVPGLITAGGSGDARLLPGAPEQWPKSGSAQVVSRAGRWSGQPLLLDEATVAATIAQLPLRATTTLAPTLWHAGAGASALPSTLESSRPMPPVAVAAPRMAPAITSAPPAVTTAGAAPRPDDIEADRVSAALVPGDRGVDRLQALIDGAAAVPRLAVRSAPPEDTPDAADAGWPTDLAPEVRPGDLRQLWTAILHDGGYHPALRGGSGAKAGLTLRRLRGLAPDQLQAGLPRLLVWFDRAGLLEAPARPDVPFGMPRLPVSTDLAWIAQQLLATPPPATDDVLVLALSRKRERSI